MNLETRNLKLTILFRYFYLIKIDQAKYNNDKYLFKKVKWIYIYTINSLLIYIIYKLFMYLTSYLSKLLDSSNLKDKRVFLLKL